MWHYASKKRCADFSLTMHEKRLAAGLRPDSPDPLGSLQRSPGPLAGFKGMGKGGEGTGGGKGGEGTRVAGDRREGGDKVGRREKGEKMDVEEG